MADSTPNCAVSTGIVAGGVLHGAEIERAEGREDQEDAEDEAPVADAVGDERLLAGVRRALLLVPVADQQVRAEADALPAHEHHQEVVPQDEHEHEEAEQVQVAEEARDAAARLVGHVGRRIDVDQRADAGDDEQHHPGQRIEAEAPGHLEAADGAVAHLQRNRRNPLRDDDVVGARLGGQRQQLPERDQRQAERARPSSRTRRRRPALRENERIPTRPLMAAPMPGSRGISQMYFMSILRLVTW